MASSDRQVTDSRDSLIPGCFQLDPDCGPGVCCCRAVENPEGEQEALEATRMLRWVLPLWSLLWITFPREGSPECKIAFGDIMVVGHGSSPMDAMWSAVHGAFAR